MTAAYFVTLGDPDLTLSQVRDWQAYLTRAAADLGLPWKLIVLPPGSEVTEAGASGVTPRPTVLYGITDEDTGDAACAE